jgi:bifunctional non-homologous end joining protein LigD
MNAPHKKGDAVVSIEIPTRSRRPVRPRLDARPSAAYCRRIVERLARPTPEHYTTGATWAKRPGRLFVDYLRNGRDRDWHLFATGAAANPLPGESLERGIRPDALTMRSPAARRKETERSTLSDDGLFSR